MSDVASITLQSIGSPREVFSHGFNIIIIIVECFENFGNTRDRKSPGVMLSWGSQ